MMRQLTTQIIPTPLGEMIALAHDAALVLLDFHDRRDIDAGVASTLARFGCAAPVQDDGHPILNQARGELTEYFTGTRQVFTIPLDVPGVSTSFDRRAWDYLRAIPFGQTRTYGQQALALGSPGAARAVGRANGQNFRSIVIPCHRVIASTGQLTGYGGGLSRKKWLIEYEASALLFSKAPTQMTGKIRAGANGHQGTIVASGNLSSNRVRVALAVE